MTHLDLFFKTTAVGFALSALIGPITILFMKKTLDIGIKGALSVGIGATLADIVFALFAIMGLNSVSDFLDQYSRIIQSIGAFFLFYLAYLELKNDPTLRKEIQVRDENCIQLTFHVFFLTLTNPLTIIMFIGIFASLGEVDITWREGFGMNSGLVVGAAIWWVILASILLRLKRHISQTWMIRIKYISALILVLCGFLALFVSPGK